MDEQVKPAQARSVGSDYWSQSRRPLASLLFAGPLLVMYEAGLICLGPNAMRNGAEAWLRQTLDLLGFNAYFLLPVLTVGILLGWHHVLRQPWHVPRRVFYGMAGECLGLALGLWLSWKLLYGFLLQAAVPSAGLSIAGFLGTIPVLPGGGHLRGIALSPDPAEPGDWPVGMDAGRPQGQRDRRDRADEFVVFGRPLHRTVGRSVSLVTFLFRFLAGVLFAVLFRYRGFGIAAGTHAFYDVLVGLWIAERQDASMRPAGGAPIPASPNCQEQMEKHSFVPGKLPWSTAGKSL